ncbi:MAG: cellulase family glycosylhydrolase [Victivallales bacterium]|nr:cellulase family glycosylhydrolase [Victivallales bacterium]
MRRIGLCVLLLSLVVYGQEFRTIPLESLKLSEFAHIEGNRLCISIPETPGITNETRGASVLLPAAEMAGKSIELQAEVRYRGVGSDLEKASHIGAKLLAVVTTAGSTSYHSSEKLRGTNWEWKSLQMFCTCSKQLEKFQLLAGVQQGWGTVEFRNLRWRFITYKFADYEVPPNFRCEYTPEVAARPVLRGVMSPSPLKLTEKDIRDLADWNANLVRFQMDGCKTTDVAEYKAWLDKCLTHLESLLPVFQECKIWYIIDMHNAPGDRYRSTGLLGTAGEAAAAAFGNAASFRMMFEDEFYEAFLDCWRHIARRFHGRPYLYGYNLVNEPVQTTPVKHGYLQLQYDAARAIREIDSDTPIVVESNGWTSPLAYADLPPLPLKNIIYQVHMYVPGEFTHQGVKDPTYKQEYPKWVRPYPNEKMKWDIALLRETLQPVVNFQKKYGARVFCGEFSAPCWAPGAEVYLNDVITLFEENGWDWTYHAFREAPLWNVEFAGPPFHPKPAPEGTPRKDVLLKWFRKNTL